MFKLFKSKKKIEDIHNYQIMMEFTDRKGNVLFQKKCEHYMELASAYWTIVYDVSDTVPWCTLDVAKMDKLFNDNKLLVVRRKRIHFGMGIDSNDSIFANYYILKTKK